MSTNNEFETWWNTIKKPLSGSKKGYKLGCKDGFNSAIKIKNEQMQEFLSEIGINGDLLNSDFWHLRLDHITDVDKKDKK